MKRDVGSMFHEILAFLQALGAIKPEKICLPTGETSGETPDQAFQGLVPPGKAPRLALEEAFGAAPLSVQEIRDLFAKGADLHGGSGSRSEDEEVDAIA